MTLAILILAAFPMLSILLNRPNLRVTTREERERVAAGARRYRRLAGRALV